MSDKINIAFSASSLNTFQICPARYNYSSNLNKSLPVSSKPLALDFGGLGHVGMEGYFNSLAQGIHFNDAVQNGIMSINSFASNPDFSNIDIDKELPPIIEAMSQSCEFWRHEDETFEILGVEEPFDYILFEDDFLRIIISGKIDLRVNKPATRAGEVAYKNLPFDHKFLARNSIISRLDNQFINYCIPTESNYLIVNVVGKQKSLKPEEKFKRVPLSYDPLYIENWKKNTIDDILITYLSYVKENVWPMKPSQINCNYCDFYNVCDVSGDEKDKLWKLETMYVDKEKWDKYKKVNGE